MHSRTSFKTGSIPAHKKASEHWVKDVGPIVESYIGFIETYVDPYGARAEWEGFTAIVDKALSAKYEVLVNGASDLIKVLPWGKDFEVDVFRKPDFTALEIVNFATGGIPAGINVCLTLNDVIRQSDYLYIDPRMSTGQAAAGICSHCVLCRTIMKPESLLASRMFHSQ